MILTPVLLSKARHLIEVHLLHEEIVLLEIASRGRVGKVVRRLLSVRGAEDVFVALELRIDGLACGAEVLDVEIHVVRQLARRLLLRLLSRLLLRSLLRLIDAVNDHQAIRNGFADCLNSVWQVSAHISVSTDTMEAGIDPFDSTHHLLLNSKLFISIVSRGSDDRRLIPAAS